MGGETADDASGIYCAVAATMDLLNSKWTLHILRELMVGRRRFNELSRALGPCSSRTLSCRLRSLELQGIVVREVKGTIPPWVEYELTDRGRALNPIIENVVTWATEHMGEELSRCREEAASRGGRDGIPPELAHMLDDCCDERADQSGL